MAFPKLKVQLPGKSPAGISDAIPRPSSRDLPDEPPPKRYVKIEGQLYEYNPSNVYTVNGVRTLYMMKGSAKPEEVTARANPPPAPAAQPTNMIDKASMALNKALQNSPLSAYSPDGVRAIIDAANEAKKNAEDRNKILEDLAK